MTANLRVLVVDDHPVNRLVFQEVFRQLGSDVTAIDGGDAMDALEVSAFDLVCLDRHMPGRTGDDLVQQLPADVLVLAWSTDTDDLPRRFHGTLPKPLTIASAERAISFARERAVSRAAA